MKAAVVDTARKPRATREAVVTAEAPPPAGPYSHAVRACGLVYLAGHTPRHPHSQAIASTFAEQARQALNNLAATAVAAGGTLRHLVRLNVYLQSLTNLDEMNEICADYLTEPYPARTTVQVGLRGILIELDGILWLG
jgi:2-iminobutanoate/2-iminopropanoate deaminase